MAIFIKAGRIRARISEVADLLSGAEVKLPPTATTVKQADRACDGLVQLVSTAPNAGSEATGAFQVGGKLPVA